MIVWLSCIFLMSSLLVINALNYMDSNVLLVKFVGCCYGYCSVSYSCIFPSIHCFANTVLSVPCFVLVGMGIIFFSEV